MGCTRTQEHARLWGGVGSEVRWQMQVELGLPGARIKRLGL